MVHTIALLECSKNIILVIRSKALLTVMVMVNDDRKGQPATQVLPDRGSVRAEKLQVEME